MKFKLFQSLNWTDTKTKNELEELGFIFIKEKSKESIERFGEWHYDSDIIPVIDIKNLDELMAFVEEYGEIVISDEEIRIYNDYIE